MGEVISYHIYMKTHQGVIKDHDDYSQEEIKRNSCVLMHILNHLGNNLKEAEGNPSYRKRERMRSKLALRQINKWIKEYDKEIV